MIVGERNCAVYLSPFTKKRKLGSNSFITTQPGIIATIYLSPIALLKNKTPYILDNQNLWS
jgi:hypothetical protein